ncbi:hypothetical protein HMN09_00112000 [Mycena chlorophos]|uniref:AttH domain-containing protein n=1 Tax=Mycena chlorophos TaxID=658473 RepID=A0A8H6WMZ5_MYCCL|nr:hypothetical protein HMN09_00112000 [Mycena chlorophos]
MSSFLLRSAIALLFYFGGSAEAHKYNIPAKVQPGTAIADLVYSSSLGLDALKISSVTNTSWDWWYFDVVSLNPDDRSSFTVVFYAASYNALPTFLPASDAATWVQIIGSYPNGTLWGSTDTIDTNGATVTIGQDFTEGVWADSGFSWTGSSSEYLISIDSPALGVKGTMSLNAIAPSHLPCGEVTNDGTMLLGGQVGWVNIIPDAVAVVDLVVGGEPFKFSGSGYHDKNWAGVPFATDVQSWYWGHARFGPYSIVWFDMLDLNGTEHVSAYVARDDKIELASCVPNAIKVRPVPDVYPPTLSTPDPTGYQISIESAPKMNVTIGSLVRLVADIPSYGRFSGNVTAVVEGGKVYHGTGLMEQFKLTE